MYGRIASMNLQSSHEASCDAYLKVQAPHPRWSAPYSSQLLPAPYSSQLLEAAVLLAADTQPMQPCPMVTVQIKVGLSDCDGRAMSVT